MKNKLQIIILLLSILSINKISNYRKQYINCKRKRNKSWKYYE